MLLFNLGGRLGSAWTRDRFGEEERSEPKTGKAVDLWLRSPFGAARRRFGEGMLGVQSSSELIPELVSAYELSASELISAYEPVAASGSDSASEAIPASELVSAEPSSAIASVPASVSSSDLVAPWDCVALVLVEGGRTLAGLTCFAFPDSSAKRSSTNE